MQSLKLGKMFGIDVELHWLSILFLLLFLFASLYLFVLMLLLLVAVLLHELAHSITSIHNNVSVSKIILILPIGGLSVLDDINLKPETEFRIAIAGPLMSIFLGVLFGLLVIFTPPGVVTQIFQFMFEINILLGILNLLPAFPTDGGRVFRSYLERKYTRYKATMLTVKLSKAIMYLLIVGTLAYVLAIKATFYYKEMLFIIALFTVFILYGGAESEEENAKLREKTKHLTVKSVVDKSFFIISPDSSISDLYNKMKKEKKHIAVTKLGKAYAYINVFDKKKLTNAKTVQDLAVEIPQLSEKTNVVDALNILENREVGAAAVTNGRSLVGLITAQHLEAFITLHILHKRKARST